MNGQRQGSIPVFFSPELRRHKNKSQQGDRAECDVGYGVSRFNPLRLTTHALRVSYSQLVIYKYSLSRLDL